MTNELATEKQTQPEHKLFLPPVNIYETKDAIIFMADMPGVDETTVDISLENDVLTVFGRSTVDAPKGYELAYAEYRPCDYRRSFTLSTDKIDRERIEATVKNGVLKVSLPKSENAKPRRIKVRAE